MKTIRGNFIYNQDAKSFLCSASNLPWKKVEIIIEGLCEPEYFDFLKRLVQLILSRTGVVNRQECLDPAFIDRVQRRVILSKYHNKKMKKIAVVAYNLVSGLFACNGNFLKSLGSIDKYQVRKIVLYILAMNLTLSMTMPEVGEIKSVAA